MNTEHELTHFNEQGRAHMVDVGMKPVTQREALAGGGPGRGGAGLLPPA